MSISKQKAKTRSPEARVFIDGDIVDVLLRYPAREQKGIASHFRKMQQSLDFSKAKDIVDGPGPLQVSVGGNITFGYRLKPAFRHIKILQMLENE